MQPIFKNYTGNPFINNALQTIEALADLDHVSEITTDILMELYKKHKIWQLFKQMKSYSMLFTRNGPLMNDKLFGDKIFKGIIEFILENPEIEGEYQCEISGLRFNTSFAEIYEKVLYEIKYPVKKIKGKDKTINRCWFPLSGALGSDAQALPQAIFDIKIHPICLVIVQFLPFSALLYKGGILLLDTINFDFSKDFIAEGVERVLQEVEVTPSKNSIENIRDFSQGDYILKAIRIYSEKNLDYEAYTDLNLWSFSNSGTGASCEIDRIPNRTFKTIYQIYRTNGKCQDDLKTILKYSSPRFLECLLEGKDYYGLYPRKIQKKKGKKTETVKLVGVSIPFFEAYQKAINNDKLKDYAKYIAYLIFKDKELKPAEIKLLEKVEPYKEPEYNTLVYNVLLRATQNGKWSLQNHLEILDKTNDPIIKPWIYGIFKMVHFYFYNQAFLKECPKPKPTTLTPILSTIIYLIENDITSERSIKRLQHQQDYETFDINRIFVRNSALVDLGKIVELIYDDYRPRKNGLNKLLRLYFNQTETVLEFKEAYLSSFKSGDKYHAFQTYQLFVETFQAYYLDKYTQDFSKYKRHILEVFPTTSRNYKIWMTDILEKMEVFYKTNPNINLKKLDFFGEEIFYTVTGEYNLTFSRFATEFLLNKHFLESYKKKKQ